MWTDRQNLSLIDDFCTQSPIIPVVAIASSTDAIPLANALLEGGIKVIEITLRTNAALESIQLIAEQLPQMKVAAGTVLNPLQYQQAIDAGAQFVISPGITETLLDKGQDNPIPLLPGISSASELMQALDKGYSRCKFFPAEAAGSIAMLKALNGPFSQVKFCPTGGITPENATAFLALSNVICVGGSWLSPNKLIEQQDWSAISQIARQSLHSCQQ
ncbi:MAG: bifunctional 4-hydroxy-2-oxoglutarate aldolase/2-dehydro-3-deoxy-phosphogluconate aldolase [Pseudomonadales bacterium]|nr:bifunctional 4-hydroxy-2-oxoglutarate aldolase/2-dehydro-3-deoxy-phosphogluconate aldolase [Pseudomonadales bacterium]NRA18087.1 bifunctional 4-hydroxy-2-oxoglutarate aldolase/2-dehydro-3-deoxy-phosphogluconate aldolase [Oceanospirillaceae bacterium]